MGGLKNFETILTLDVLKLFDLVTQTRECYVISTVSKNIWFKTVFNPLVSGYTCMCRANGDTDIITRNTF